MHSMEPAITPLYSYAHIGVDLYVSYEANYKIALVMHRWNSPSIHTYYDYNIMDSVGQCMVKL